MEKMKLLIEQNVPKSESSPLLLGINDFLFVQKLVMLFQKFEIIFFRKDADQDLEHLASITGGKTYFVKDGGMYTLHLSYTIQHSFLKKTFKKIHIGVYP